MYAGDSKTAKKWNSAIFDTKKRVTFLSKNVPLFVDKK
jgi:hypothetical protein